MQASARTDISPRKLEIIAGNILFTLTLVFQFYSIVSAFLFYSLQKPPTPIV